MYVSHNALRLHHLSDTASTGSAGTQGGEALPPTRRPRAQTNLMRPTQLYCPPTHPWAEHIRGRSHGTEEAAPIVRATQLFTKLILKQLIFLQRTWTQIDRELIQYSIYVPNP